MKTDHFELIAQLANDWSVEIETTGAGWKLTLTSYECGDKHVYRGPNLGALVVRAYGGERGDA